uniref:Uncharacterized protein n=1 Tax=Clytia hemisphaerica TaxID=252671 RepID=A0A7M5XGK5_9CNID
MQGFFHEDRQRRNLTMASNTTWEKFGENLAVNGGRMMGLYDELFGFFGYCDLLTSKGKGTSDNQTDFLTFFNGGSRRRETISGNANFDLNFAHFTILGFTQPSASISLLTESKQTKGNSSSTYANSTNNGFVNRFLWYFPRPIYAHFEDLAISNQEKQELNNL